MSSAWKRPAPSVETTSTKSAPESAKTSTALQSGSIRGSRPERFSIPCAAAPAENSPASSLSEKRAPTSARSPPTSVSWKTSLPSGSTSLKSGGRGRSSRVSSRPGSPMILPSAHEVLGRSAREERRHSEGRETAEEQNPERRTERRGERSCELRVRGLRDAATHGRLQKGVRVGEKASETGIVSCCPVHGGPVALPERGVQQSAHHGDPERAADGTEEDYRRCRHAASPPGHGVLHADQVARAREAESEPDHDDSHDDVGEGSPSVHR